MKGCISKRDSEHVYISSVIKTLCKKIDSSGQSVFKLIDYKAIHNVL